MSCFISCRAITVSGVNKLEMACTVLAKKLADEGGCKSSAGNGFI